MIFAGDPPSHCKSLQLSPKEWVNGQPGCKGQCWAKRFSFYDNIRQLRWDCHLRYLKMAKIAVSFWSSNWCCYCCLFIFFFGFNFEVWLISVWQKNPDTPTSTSAIWAIVSHPGAIVDGWFDVEFNKRSKTSDLSWGACFFPLNTRSVLLECQSNLREFHLFARDVGIFSKSTCVWLDRGRRLF